MFSVHTIICSSQQEKEGASMETSGQNVVQLLLAEVRPDSEQPRKYFDPDELEELLLSIKENGLRNPIHVKPDTDTGEGYLIVAGERRFRCVTALGETTIRAFVMPANTDALVFGLVDNLNRANLNSMEEAWGYAKLLERGLTQADIARKVGKTAGHVSNTLLLVQLPEEVQQAVAKKQFSASAGIALVRRCKDQEEMETVFREFKRRHDSHLEKMTAGSLKIFLDQHDRLQELAKKGIKADFAEREELRMNVGPAALRLLALLDELLGDGTAEARARFIVVWKSFGPRGGGELLAALRGVNERTKKFVGYIQDSGKTVQR